MEYPISEKLDSGIILETDFCGDVDDVGALALLCSRESTHHVPILGISINVNRPFIVPGVDAVLSFLGHKQLPLAICEKEEERWSPYLKELAGTLPADRRATLKTQKVTDFYKNILENAPDHSISILSIGFFCNLSEAYRAMPELFEQKVRCVYVMAGSFENNSAYLEYNIREKPEDSVYFFRNCRRPLIFITHETGIHTMTDLRGLEDRTDNPIVMAYKAYTEGSMCRPSWDPITVDFAFSGENEYYALSEAGKLTIDDAGFTFHHPEAGGNARYLIYKKTDEEIGAHITAEIKAASRL